MSDSEIDAQLRQAELERELNGAWWTKVQAVDVNTMIWAEVFERVG